MPPLLLGNRSGGERCRGVAEIGLAVEFVRDARKLQCARHVLEVHFRWDGQHDKVGMITVNGNQPVSGSLD